jgi:hypothetical protein
MWTTIANGFKALLDNSPITLVLGVMVIVISVVDVFIAKKNWKETTAKIIAAVISLALLFAQAKSSTKAAAQEATRLQDALNKQRDQLTSAFMTGTNQVINATSETAKQTQRSAKQQTEAIEKQAKQQTDEIKQQAALQYTQLQTNMIGTSSCPDVVIGNVTGGRPNIISVANQDQTLNMYDVRLEVDEMAPVDPNQLGSPWTSVLHSQVIIFPQVVPHWALRESVTFYSKMTDIWVSFRVTTRATNCNGQISLFDIGKNQWRTYNSALFQGNKPVNNYYVPLSPGLQKSKPDPDFQEPKPDPTKP